MDDLPGWTRVDIARLRRIFAEETAIARAAAHEHVDRVFDAQVAVQELRLAVLERDAAGEPRH